MRENVQNVTELIDMVGARFETVARMGSHEADTVLFRTSMPAGKVVPLHSHIDPECFYVLDGQVEVLVIEDAPRRYMVGVGRSIVLSGGVKHLVRNTSDQSSDLIVATNNRLANYFREAGRSATPGSELRPPSADDIQRLIRVSQLFGYWIATPSETAAVIADVGMLGPLIV